MKKQICCIASLIFVIAILCTALTASAISVTEGTPSENISSMQLQNTQLPDQTGNETINLAAAVMKVMASLALVVGIMLLLTYFFKKMGMSGGKIKQGSLIQVMDTRMIAPKKYIAVLQVAREYVVVGITDQNISLLSKLENSPELVNYFDNNHTQSEAAFGLSFSSLLNKAATKISSSEKHKDTQP